MLLDFNCDQIVETEDDLKVQNKSLHDQILTHIKL